mmetsp:Transcript_98256/g.278227  ORF Transcript_98256/g.278227 Transcript_98256/m.278227 type:complete len:362 (-) Transcript_98256:70-1155(-)
MGLMQVVRPTQALPLWLLGTLLCSRLLAAGGALSDASALLQRHPDLPVAAEVEDNILHMDTGLVPAKGHGIKDRDAAGSTGKLLIFIAVGNSKEVMKAVAANIDHLRRTCGGVMDVFLAHYDEKRDFWLERNRSWYEESVTFHAESQGHKFLMASKLLPPLLMYHGDYSWIWLADEDLYFKRIDISYMLESASRSGALIAQPALGFPRKRRSRRSATSSACRLGEREQCTVLKPDPRCRYRYTDFIEVMTPLFRQDALVTLLTHCTDHCFHNESVWGLDRLWCHWTAKKFEISFKKTCVVLDHSIVEHLEYESLPKYSGDTGTRNRSLRANFQAKSKVKRHHREDFVSKPRTFECVPRAEK